MGPSVSSRLEVSKHSPQQSAPEDSSHAFGLAVKELGSTLHLRLTGEFDVTCVGRVEVALERVSDEDTRRVVFDLSGVSFLDYAGVHAILRANERARGAAFDVVVVRPRGLANRVFTLTRAGKQLKLVDQTFPANGGSC